MENLKDYSSFLFEKQGISPAIYSELKKYFHENKETSFEGAKNYVASQTDGWELSEEDFEEAERNFKSK
jgi:hypothetical protein